MAGFGQLGLHTAYDLRLTFFLLTQANFERLTTQEAEYQANGRKVMNPGPVSCVSVIRQSQRSVIGGGFMHVYESASSIRPTLNPNASHVHEVVRQAHEELRQLLQKRAEVMRRIGTIKQTIAGLANLFGDEVLSDELLELIDRKSGGRQPGFTKACRMVLMDSNRALSARDVCDRLQEKAPPLMARHKDPMASVTTVLNRLVGYGEAKAVSLENGRRAWRWVADAHPESAATAMSA
jgi:hypothetical protein